MSTNDSTRYGPTFIALHWGVVLLMAAIYGCIEMREFYPKGSDPREALKMWHFMLGMTLFALVWVRLGLRFFSPSARAARSEAGLAARVAHALLYIFMIGLPLTGWLLLSAAGKPIPFFGLELPALVGTNKDLAKQLKELHQFVGMAGYYLIGLHAVAALFHHYVLKDHTLERMLPNRR